MMVPKPASDELWGSHSMPTPCQFDILMPNGLLLNHDFKRDTCLLKVKEKLWSKAKNDVLFRKLKDIGSYVFVGVTTEGKVEEFYDERKNLYDLHLFSAFLQLKLPEGDKAEKILYSEISSTIGRSVSEFDASKDQEINECRKNFISISQRLCEERKHLDIDQKLRYYYPCEREAHQSATSSKDGSLYDFKLSCQFEKCESSYSLPLDITKTPEEVVNYLRSERIKELPSSAIVLKACAYDEYFLEQCSLSQFKYINRCISQGTTPELYLRLKSELEQEVNLTGDETEAFIFPPALNRVASQGTKEQVEENIRANKLTLLWMTCETFKLDINFVTYANVRDTDQIFVNAAIFHGNELIGRSAKTSRQTPQNPKWMETLEFGLLCEDIPKSARLCLGLCAVHKKMKKLTPTLEAWVNILLFDYKDYLRAGKMHLSLWKPNKDHMDLLNPMGVTCPNPDIDATSLEIEFSQPRTPVIFPPQQSIDTYASILRENSSRKNSLTAETSDLKNLVELIKPFAELTEDDKLLVWELREHCQKTFPDSLPVLLEVVPWHDRGCVTQMYDLLDKWKPVKVDTALELLDLRYPDPKVRTKSVEWLNLALSDAELCEYLLQMVHVALKESYYDNALSRFLLKRALRNRLIGHHFFWLLKAEIHDSSNSVRCELLLEAYCRGIDRQQLRRLTKQVNALDKLTVISNDLNDKRDATQRDRILLLQEIVQRADFSDALKNFRSPLKYFPNFGELLVENCRIMDSAKRPLWLVWNNGYKLPEKGSHLNARHAVIFKNGDDLRQDMLTLQVIKIMDSLWRSEGLDLKMMAYTCLATGNQVGMIEVVQNAKTVMHRQRECGLRATLQVGSKELHRWFDKVCAGDEKKYDKMIKTFTASCAGYCVATFVLGIGDRNPDNIMINEDGQIFHIDFGHFLGHFKKKFGITRERVPFVLTDDFLFVICRGKGITVQAISDFNKTCERAYGILRKHSNLLVTLFTLMLSTGIPELQSPDDIYYLKRTLQVDVDDETALSYFRTKMVEARSSSMYTKIDWFFHNVKHS